jgi:hypothetical protein
MLDALGRRVKPLGCIPLICAKCFLMICEQNKLKADARKKLYGGEETPAFEKVGSWYRDASRMAALESAYRENDISLDISLDDRSAVRRSRRARRVRIQEACDSTMHMLAAVTIGLVLTLVLGLVLGLVQNAFPDSSLPTDALVFLLAFAGVGMLLTPFAWWARTELPRVDWNMIGGLLAVNTLYHIIHDSGPRLGDGYRDDIGCG